MYITNNYGWIGPEDNTEKKPKHQKENKSAIHESKNDESDNNDNDCIPIDKKKTSNTVLVKKELMTTNNKKRKEKLKNIQYTFEKESRDIKEIIQSFEKK